VDCSVLWRESVVRVLGFDGSDGVIWRRRGVGSVCVCVEGTRVAALSSCAEGVKFASRSR